MKGMGRLLVITLLEYRARPNNRVQHSVESLAAVFEEVCLLYRAEPLRAPGWPRIRNLFPSVAPPVQEGNLRAIEFNPPLNWVERYDFSHGPGRVEKRRRTVIRHLSNLFGLTREFLFIGFLVLVCLFRLRGPRFDVCLVETAWEAIPALLMRRLGRVRVVVFDDNDFGPGYMQNGLRRSWEMFLEKACIRSADLVISAGYLLGDLWRRETGVKVEVIPNGVDLRRFRGEVRRIDAEAPCLAYIGNLSSSWMDFPGLFSAIASLAGRFPGLRLVLVGDEGEARFRELEREARACGIRDRVRFAGRVPHDRIPEALAECHIGLATAPANLLRKYAFPLKITEYMALGMPVIASAGTEAERVVTRCGCGLCVDGSAGALRAAIERLIDDEAFYRECSRNGLEKAPEFGLERLTRRRIEAIERVVRRAGRSRSAPAGAGGGP
jgi:glycosyltransferase involved in cell wall biosynthesis